MHVTQEQLQAAIEKLEVAKDALSKQSKLSALNEAVKETISDVLDDLDMQPLPAYDTDVSHAVATYIALRDSLSADRKAWDEHERNVKLHLMRISNFLADAGRELGVDSFATKYGTAYKVTKEQYRIENWPDYAKWLLETGNINCLEKRPAKLAVKEIEEETGNIPPGLTKHVEEEFQVRRR